MDFVNIFMKLLCCEDCDNLSEDHLRNLKYNMIVRTALIAHYCIKGGMTSEKSYSIRDYYIMKTDKCKTESEIRTVHRKMIESYTNKMRHIKLRGVYSKQIVRALDYIIGHLYQRIFIKETAEYLKISPALDDSAAKAYCQGLPAAKCYVDNSESYSTNEITIYWNSPFTYLLSYRKQWYTD